MIEALAAAQHQPTAAATAGQHPTIRSELDMSLRCLIARLKGVNAESDTGATATEYAILLGFIAIVIVVGITAFGNQLNAFYNVLATKLASFL